MISETCPRCRQEPLKDSFEIQNQLCFCCQAEEVEAELASCSNPVPARIAERAQHPFPPLRGGRMRTQDIALKTLYGGANEQGLIPELLMLATDKASTSDLEEAVKKADLILVTLRTWVSARHLIEAAPHAPITRSEIDAENSLLRQVPA